jgi:FHA domain
LGDGRRGLLENRIVVRLLSADPARRALLENALSADEGLRAAVLQRMETAGHSVPPDLSIEIRNEAAPALTSAERDYEILAAVEGKPAASASGAAATEAPQPPQPRPRARLVTLEGDDPPREVEIDRDVFNIGRVREVLEKSHRPARRNHLYFAESATTVSRSHAHIRYYPETGEFRIFDDRSARGTRVFSGGEPVDVPPGRSRGEQLRSGDEVYFGSVAVRFEVLED